MATAIYFIARAYLRMQKKFEQVTQEYNEFLKETQSKQVETIVNFTVLLQAIKENFEYLKRRSDGR